MFDDFAILYLHFDSTSGPQVVDSYFKNLNLNEEQILSIKSSSFPDSVVQEPNQFFLYVFRIDAFFCYCIFTSMPEKSEPRGHLQISFVIVSKLPYIYIFSRILHSTLSVQDMHPKDTFLVLCDFVEKTINICNNISNNEIVQIPTFDGELRVQKMRNVKQGLDLIAGLKWCPQCKVYCLNDCFLGIDLFESLGVYNLLNNGRISDILKLWESALLGKSILVYGANPNLTSSCALGIASLLFPEKFVGNIIPFMSVTDIRFKKMIIDNVHVKNLILGVSNPIALQIENKFDLIFTIGFGQKRDGLNISRSNWESFPTLNNINSSVLRSFFYQNTRKTIKAINICLNDLRNTNPYDAFVGNICLSNLIKQIHCQKVTISGSLSDFAAELLKSPIFPNICLKIFSYDSFLEDLHQFSIETICKSKSKSQLTEIFNLLKKARQRCLGKENLEKIIDADITNVSLYLQDFNVFQS